MSFGTGEKEEGGQRWGVLTGVVGHRGKLSKGGFHFIL